MARLKKNQLLIFMAALLAFVVSELAKAIGMNDVQAIIVTGPSLLIASGIAFVFRKTFVDDFWLPCLFFWSWLLLLHFRGRYLAVAYSPARVFRIDGLAIEGGCIREKLNGRFFNYSAPVSGLIRNMI